MSPEIRTVTESEYPDWMRALATGFLMPPTPSEQDLKVRRSGTDLDRTLGAFDGGRCVATYRTHPQWLSVPGGARVDANAITNITVASTHRRRGLLSRMMARDLAVAKERGDVVATLTSAEYPIYGRFGFAPATSMAAWTVDLPRTGLDRRATGPACGGRIDLADMADIRALGPALHERVAALTPGMVSRSERWWQLATGVLQVSSDPWTEPLSALYRSASGEVEGLVVYAADGKWNDAQQPLNTLTVRDLLALTPAAERALWHHVCSVDWATGVEVPRRAPDDVLPLLLPDPRAARTTSIIDGIWLRFLDTPRALAARTYGTTASLVLDIRDELGHGGGRFLLDTTPEGTTCTTTTRTPDLTLPAPTLARLYLGDESPHRLAALGLLEENSAGALTLADHAFRTPRRPWCPDVF
ncbi:GNAT family N-acetyltransferase [Streptomyces yaizuensis]|uniref:GNAT family N-acetyltransferase n=1 Tax=Streptomyces yaizuensis TaxID=2989713 RepID=A0ABQ5PAZ9_9ACTN|nr:GNAT family N-acetyltransferase [Streptomyces sp. YSPA8]GLF99751.1 GNAT family N-acetyltransferase [Streptomyces sp. YSPA8]